MKKIRIVMGAVIALVMAVAGCGEGAPVATKVYEDAGKEMGSLTSYHVSVNWQRGSDSLDFSEMDIVPPDGVEASFRWGEESPEFTLLGIGGEAYVKVAEWEDWYVYSEPVLDGPFPDMTGFVSGLWTKIFGLSEVVEEEELVGVSTRRLSGMLPAEVLELMGDEDASPEGVPVELWAGAKDSLVRRVRWVEKEVGKEDSVITLTFSRFEDQTIRVVAPANPRSARELEEEWQRYEEETGSAGPQEHQTDAVPAARNSG